MTILYYISPVNPCTSSAAVEGGAVGRIGLGEAFHKLLAANNVEVGVGLVLEL